MNNQRFKNMNLKQRFESRGFGVLVYARAYSINKDKNAVSVAKVTLDRILSGKATGEKESKNGVTRTLIAQLKKDKVWIGPLPWECQNGV